MTTGDTLLAGARSRDDHETLGIVDGVDDSVVTDPNAIVVPAPSFLVPTGRGSKTDKSTREAEDRLERAVDLVELLPRQVSCRSTEPATIDNAHLFREDTGVRSAEYHLRSKSCWQSRCRGRGYQDCRERQHRGLDDHCITHTPLFVPPSVTRHSNAEYLTAPHQPASRDAVSP